MFFQTKLKTSTEAQNLMTAMRNVSTALLDEAEAYAWQEHEAGRLSDSVFFVVVRRLQLLAGAPSTPDTKTST